MDANEIKINRKRRLGNTSITMYGTSEYRGAAEQTDRRFPPWTHVLVAFRLNVPLSSLDPNV